MTAPLRAKFALLSPQQRFLLAVLGATSFFDGYDRSILEIALPQIRDSFDVTQSQASLWIAVLYLGAVPALGLARRADSHGRKQLLLISIAGYTLATVATAFAPTIEVYTLCQFVARLFLIAESAVVWTLAAEELPAEVRGLGFGILGMNNALGVGFGAILFGTVFDPLGLSWRWLYVAGVPALFLVALLRRRLPESGRFAAARLEGALAPSWRVITRSPHRKWLALVAAATFFSELVTHASVFVLDFLQTDRGLTATDTSLMLIAAGLPGIPAMVIAGSLSDRYGRRAVGCSAAVLSAVGALAFFWLPGGIPVLLPAMSVMLVGSMGSQPVLNGYATELFPTSLRSQASSWAALARVVGQAASLAAGAALLATTGSMPLTTTILVGGALMAVVLYATMFPDTHGRELEELSPPIASRAERKGEVDRASAVASRDDLQLPADQARPLFHP